MARVASALTQYSRPRNLALVWSQARCFAQPRGDGGDLVPAVHALAQRFNRTVSSLLALTIGRRDHAGRAGAGPLQRALHAVVHAAQRDLVGTALMQRLGMGSAGFFQREGWTMNRIARSVSAAVLGALLLKKALSISGHTLRSCWTRCCGDARSTGWLATSNAAASRRSSTGKLVVTVP